jgi:uncharacterized membrane protein YfcA
MANLRVAMLLELGTTTGALTGAYLAGVVGGRWLFIIFGLVLGYSAVAMLRSHREDGGGAGVPPDRLADRLRLHGTYYDAAVGREVAYRVTRTPLGLCLMYVAGVVSGLLGIGSGALKVPAMDLAMRLPIKASSATSNFMIGVTAAASAGIYFWRGEVLPLVAAPIAIGVLLGSIVGARKLVKYRSSTIRSIFIVLMVGVAIQMLLRGMGVI